MNGTLIEIGPKMDWTRDNKIYDRYLLWKDKVEITSVQFLQMQLHNKGQDILDSTTHQKMGFYRQDGLQ